MALVSEVRLDDPDFYVADPYPALAALRRDSPIFYYEPADVWALSRHKDNVFALRNPQLFSSRFGVSPDEHEHPERIADRTVDGSEFMMMTDPPRHTELRKMINAGFTHRSVSVFEDRLRMIIRDTLDRVPSGEPFDFYQEVARQIPIRAVCDFMGIPAEDVDWFKETSAARTDAYESTDASTAAKADRLVWEEYFTRILAERARHPKNDVLTLIANAGNGESFLPTRLMFCIDLLFAGNETTDPVMSGGLKALIEHGDQLEALKSNLSLVPNAVEEMLRWVTPVVSMCRTAMEDVEIRGQVIPSGAYMYLLFIAANRDEEVWEAPETFDVTRRDAAKHLTFGGGPHTCIGAGFSRLELRVLFEELLTRFASLELAGEVVCRPNIFMTGISSMPVIFDHR